MLFRSLKGGDRGTDRRSEIEGGRSEERERERERGRGGERDGGREIKEEREREDEKGLSRYRTPWFSRYCRSSWNSWRNSTSRIGWPHHPIVMLHVVTLIF